MNNVCHKLLALILLFDDTLILFAQFLRLLKHLLFKGDGHFFCFGEFTGKLAENRCGECDEIRYMRILCRTDEYIYLT